MKLTAIYSFGWFRLVPPKTVDMLIRWSGRVFDTHRQGLTVRILGIAPIGGRAVLRSVSRILIIPGFCIDLVQTKLSLITPLAPASMEDLHFGHCGPIVAHCQIPRTLPLSLPYGVPKLLSSEPRECSSSTFDWVESHSFSQSIIPKLPSDVLPTRSYCDPDDQRSSTQPLHSIVFKQMGRHYLVEDKTVSSCTSSLGRPSCLRR